MGRRVLLLINNAPRHFEAFDQDYERIVFFSPNCTSSKQPCDMGIRTTLNKRYKYLYVKDVIDFNQIDDEKKARYREQGQ